MIYKKLGSSKLTVSAIGLGTGTGFKFIDKNSDGHLKKIIRKAFGLGINFFDTAEVYFDGHAEQILGQALKSNRNKAVIATKFSPEHSRFQDVLKSADGSLKRLETDYIDIYQIHWPNNTIPQEDTAKALIKLFKDGKIKSIGVSNFSLKQLQQIQKFLGKVKIVSLQTEYNLLERSAENLLLPFCQKNNISLIAYTPLSSGLLLKKEDYFSKLKLLSFKYKKSISQIILNWLISHKNVLAIPATTNFEHLIQNASAADFKLKPKDIESIDQTFKQEIITVTTNQINVASTSDHKAYQTLKQALENKLNLFPSPSDLALEVKDGDFLKPVKLKLNPNNKSKYKYILTGGRIRYWAWVIAHHGKKPIPAIVE